LARIEESIEINASQPKIWSLFRWERVPDWMNMITKVEYTSEELETIGATAHWVGEAGGLKSEWDTETTEWLPYTRSAWRTTSGTFTAIGSMTLNSIESGTRAIFTMDYDLPYSFLGKIVDKLRVCKAIEKGTINGLKHLKEMAEK
jgi:uncharacterized membrane protein